jgi:HTH-type transcriptional regulator / antitoxin HigA
MEEAIMKTRARLRFKEMPKDFKSLVMMFMPRAVHDEVDYDNTMEVIDELAGHDLTDDQEIYLDTLTTLVEAYEDEHHAIKVGKMSPVEALKYLMEQSGMSPGELGKLLGERTLGSKILRGERKIGVTYAKALAKRFCVDVGLFIE